MVFGEMRLAGLSFHMELLAKLSFQVGAARCGHQWIPAHGGKGMVPIAAKLWFKPQRLPQLWAGDHGVVTPFPDILWNQWLRLAS
jgi:hypothetical protein